MPTPQAYDRLYREHQALKASVVRYLSSPAHEREEDELWELAGDYEGELRREEFEQEQREEEQRRMENEEMARHFERYPHG